MGKGQGIGKKGRTQQNKDTAAFQKKASAQSSAVRCPVVLLWRRCLSGVLGSWLDTKPITRREQSHIYLPFFPEKNGSLEIVFSLLNITDEF